MTAAAPIKLPVETLIIGGEESFVRRTVIPKLAMHGLKATAVWSWNYVSAIPMKVDAIFFLTDMLGHSTYNTLLTEARKYGIKVINGTRKWALNVQRLERAGFPYNPNFQPPSEAEIDAIQIGEEGQYVPEEMFKSIEKLVTGDSKKMKRNHKYVEVAEPAPTPAVEPEPTPAVEPEPTPAVEPEPAPWAAGVESNPDYERIRKLVLSAPQLSNDQLCNRLQIAPKVLYKYVASIRRTSGIYVSGSPHIRLDRDLYVKTCKHFGVTPVEGNNLLRCLPDATSRDLWPDPTPTPAPVPTPAPAPVISASAAREDLQEIKDIVTMLREEMAKRGVTRLVITPSGTEFERTVIVKGTF